MGDEHEAQWRNGGKDGKVPVLNWIKLSTPSVQIAHMELVAQSRIEMARFFLSSTPRSHVFTAFGRSADGGVYNIQVVPGQAGGGSFL